MALGYLRRDEGTKKYELSPRLLDFAYHYVASNEMLERALPYVQQLALDTEEATNLSVLDEADVVFGTGPVTRDSLQRYVREYPDSALRFLLRREIDGRLLAREIESVHEQWQERGLVRGRVNRYLLELMSWEEIPDLPIHELLGEMRRHLVSLSVTGGV